MYSILNSEIQNIFVRKNFLFDKRDGMFINLSSLTFHLWTVTMPNVWHSKPTATGLSNRKGHNEVVYG